jgi:phenylalanyl-tRNA synthetase beta chain
VKLPCTWLAELVKTSADPDRIAAALALRGFEVASIEAGRQPVIDFEITANRPDCLSVIGLAREVSAAFGIPIQLPDRTMPPAGQLQSIEVTIEDAELCPRYCAQVFELRSAAAAPAWLRERLEAAGVRSISPVVDVTNYVMLEMGQPTHAFDYAKLAGKALRIRRARPGEKIRTLDGVDRALDPEMLVIADAERPQAVGGVMGGADSEISSSTKLMVLESAYFKPGSVRRTSKRLGLKTEASIRFERGADVNGASVAIARAAALLQQIGAAQPLGPTIDRYPSPRPPLTIALRAARIARVLGTPVADADVPARLQPLGFTVARSDPGVERGGNSGSGIARRPSPLAARWAVTVPTFRVDVLREIDLIEEVARHDGYASLPATFPELVQAPPEPQPKRDSVIRRLLTASGFSEAITFSFVEAAAAAPFTADAGVVTVANPLSEKFAVMRPSLLPGLIDAAAHNRRREHHDVRLFETGIRFSAAGETAGAAGVWTGAGTPAHWSAAPRPVDVFDLKGIVEALGRAFGAEVACEPASAPWLVDGQTALVTFRMKARVTHVGLIGRVQPAILDARGFPPGEPLFAFELNVDGLAASDVLRAESLPRFPSITRDLSVLVDTALPAATVRGTIRSAAPATLLRVVEFDRYRGKGVPDGRVSLSLRLTFRSNERTLTDTEIDAAMKSIVSRLMLEHNAVQR